MSRQKAAALAKRTGCTLDYQRRHWHGGGCVEVTIYLPEGVVFDGNPGLDVLHHETELDDDIWQYVVADLQTIAEDADVSPDLAAVADMALADPPSVAVKLPPRFIQDCLDCDCDI